MVVAMGTVHMTCLPALRGDGHPSMVGDGRIDVHEVDVRVGQHVVIAGVARVDAEGVADGVALGVRALADGVHVRLWMLLVDGDEFRAEAESDNGDTHLLVVPAHGHPPRVGNWVDRGCGWFGEK
jgi:hypothetical protein